MFILVGIKTVKDLIRVPNITPENQAIKDKIITLAQELLNLENVKFGDFVDFKNVMVQKFDKITTSEDGVPQLLLWNGGNVTKCKIKKDAELVTEFINKTAFLTKTAINLQTLKNQIVIDETKQAAIIEKMNDLVFCLYFNVQLIDLQENTFYKYLENAKK